MCGGRGLRRGRGRGQGQGRGRGRRKGGRCVGRGPGRGRGRGRRRGRGRGRRKSGRCVGRGQEQGQGLGQGRGRGRQKSGRCVGPGLGQGQALVRGRGRRKCGRCDRLAQSRPRPCWGSWLLQLLRLLRRWPLTLSLSPSVLPWLPLSLPALMPPLMLMLMLPLILMLPPALLLRLRPALPQTSGLTPAPAAWTGQRYHACHPHACPTPPPPSADHYLHHLPYPWFPDTSGSSLLRSHRR